MYWNDNTVIDVKNTRVGSRSSCSAEENIEFGTGKLRLAVEDGDVVNGSLMAGQSSGLVRDIVTVKEVIERMVAEAEQIIAGLQGVVA